MARGAGQEDLTRLQMEESGLGEELAAHPDGDKSERCQSHLQWKTTKWLVGRQLVDEGAGNCSSLLSPPPCIKTCSAPVLGPAPLSSAREHSQHQGRAFPPAAFGFFCLFSFVKLAFFSLAEYLAVSIYLFPSLIFFFKLLSIIFLLARLLSQQIIPCHCTCCVC